MVFLFICSSILWICLLIKYGISEYERCLPLRDLVRRKNNICHCKLWHTKCYNVVDAHTVSPDIRAAHYREIARAFSSVQDSVIFFSKCQNISAEHILDRAVYQMTPTRTHPIEQVYSAVKDEYMFVANCLKDAWPLLAPKIIPGRAFVKVFCENLKASKDLFYTAADEPLSHLLSVMKECIILVRKGFSSTVSSGGRHSRLKAVELLKVQHILFRISTRMHQSTSQVSDLKSQLLRLLNEAGIKQIVAIDTEMVGAGLKGTIDMVARVSLVNKKKCIYDKYVKPTRYVTDYRTIVSGIHEKDLIDAEDCETVQKEVADLINNRIVVGHDLEKDLNVLELKHPFEDKRDTALYGPFRTVPHEKPSLKYLAKQFLDRDIQNGEHCTVEDASAAMGLYLKVAEQWEKMLDK